jgi:Mn-dependent DtxR family transcriptional regulator
VTGKFTPDNSWNMVRTNGLFEIDGHTKDAARKRNKAQNAIYNLIKENAGIKQIQIATKLNKQASNVSRDVKKLLKTGHLTGSPIEGYTITKTP